MKCRLSCKLRCLLGAALFIGFVAPSALKGQQYIFHAYQQADGLANLGVQSMSFDQHGFLWVATQNGVMRFLGSRFEHYGPGQGLTERNISEVYADPAGRVFAGTFKNIYLWNTTRFDPVTEAPVPIDQGSSSLLTLTPNVLLIISREQLLRVNLGHSGDKKPSPQLFFSSVMRGHVPALDQISTMTTGRDGTLWLGCGSKLCSFRLGVLKTWGASDGVVASTWRTLHEDRRGSLWAFSQSRLLELPAGKDHFVDRTPPTLPGGVFYWAPLAEDSQGRILVNAAAGLSRWDGVRWQVLGVKDGLLAKRVTDIAFDPHGDAWIGSLTGLTRWSGYEHWEGWTGDQGLPNSTIWSIDPHHADHVLIGTVEGAARLDLARQKVDSLVGQADWTYGQVGGIAEDRKGRVWVTTFSGFVLIIDPATRRVKTVAKLSAFIHRLVMTDDGAFWILSGLGIDVVERPEDDRPTVRHLAEPDRLLDSQSNTVTMAAAPALDVNRESKGIGPTQDVQKATEFSSGTASDQDLWFLTVAGPLRRKAGHWTRPVIDGMPTANMLLDEISFAPDGSFWLSGFDDAEHAGVWHVESRGDKYHATRLFMPAHLVDAIVYAFLVDRRGWLWLGTDVGLFGWNGSSWREFNQESGLIWNDIDRGVLSEATDGSLWVGTMGGAAHLLHPESAFDPVALSVDILAMHRGNSDIGLREAATLPWASIPVRFDFAAPAASNRSSLTFFYRLAGIDSSWMQTQNTQVDFPALGPGTYRFEVYAFNSATSSRSPVMSREFRILPPWWKTPWAYLLYLVLALLVFWLSLYLWTRQLRLNQQKLEGLVLERTSALEQSREEMRILATRDSLTGLLNRAGILASLDQELDRARRTGMAMAVMIADIDHFKQVNDTYGHPAGDEVLRSFAFGLSRNLRAYDHVGRYGGEEFLLVLPSTPHENFIDRLIRFHAEVSNQAVQVESHQLTVNCSIGVVILDGSNDNRNASESLSSADRALYQAKRAGRNRLVLDGSNHLPVAEQEYQHRFTS